MDCRFFQLFWTLNKTLAKISPLKKKAELRLGHDNVPRMVGVYLREKAFLQAFCNDYKACSIVVQALARGATGVGKHEQVTREWVLLQDLLHLVEQRVIGGAHVRRTLGEIYACPAVETDHATFFRKSMS